MLQIFIPEVRDLNWKKWWTRKQEFSPPECYLLWQLCNKTFQSYFLMLCNICWNVLFIIWKLINVVKDRQMQPQISQRFFGEPLLFNPDYFILLPRWLIFWLASNCCRVLGLRGQSVAQVQAAAFVGKPSAVGNHCRQLLKTTIVDKYCWQLF